MKAIFAGTFDPFTLGHRDIVERAAKVFGGVTVAVAEDTGKTTAPISVRLEIAKASVSGIPGVSVQAFSGLLTDYMKMQGDCVIVRGVRNARDAEYERDLTRVYESLSGVDAVCFFTKAELEHVSSTVVRQLAELAAPLDGYVFVGAKDLIVGHYSKHC